MLSVGFVLAVVKEGTIVEQGTHHELLGLEGGAYATLVQLQLSGAELEGSKPARFGDDVESETSDKVCLLHK